MSRGILVTAGVKETLLAHAKPIEVLKQGEKIGFQRGMLTVSILEQMIAEFDKQKPLPEKLAAPIGRTIAPIKEPEPVKIQYRNNLPDWKE